MEENIYNTKTWQIGILILMIGSVTSIYPIAFTKIELFLGICLVLVGLFMIHSLLKHDIDRCKSKDGY